MSQVLQTIQRGNFSGLTTDLSEAIEEIEEKFTLKKLLIA